MTTMIGIGVYGDGGVFDPATSQIYNIDEVNITNAVFDEVDLFDGKQNTANEKGKWNSNTKFVTKFLGNLEAGNISLGEAEISGLKVKRKRKGASTYKDLATVDYIPNSMMTYYDYFAASSKDYEYAVVPIDNAGIEGVISTIYTSPDFEGWWLIDPDNPEDGSFHFYYNLEDVSISTYEDRTELNTFAKYPKVYYGQKRAKHGSLSGLFIPEKDNVVKQYEKLESIISKHKPLLLKDGEGRCYFVDVSAPNEVAVQRPSGISSININWVEVDEYND